MTQLTRRSLLFAGVSATLLSVAPGSRAATQESGGRKLVVVILRGAMDGLAALPKLDDPDIRTHRAALIDPDATPLSDGFALHSALPTLAQFYRDREAAFIPAIAGPYRERSHFEAQDLLETGEVRNPADSGWLNRALQKAPGAYSAVSIGLSQPLLLRGAATRITSWSPLLLPEASDDTLNRLLALYDGDRLLKSALEAAVKASMVAGEMEPTGVRKRSGGATAHVVSLFEAAGNFLSRPDGPELAVVSLEGWDTHVSQNNVIKQRLTSFDTGLAALRKSLGKAWDKTAVVAVSEFGRTVRVNGGQGTDHGTAGLGILAGGAIRGGRMLGDWPTLKSSALYENRDLAPTLDARGVFKGLLRDHLGWSANDLDATVFRDSASTRPVGGLV